MKTRTKRHHLKKGRKTFRKKTKGGFWPFDSNNAQPTTSTAPLISSSNDSKKSWWSSLFSKTPAPPTTQ
jgi:hypothetical protein